jgi:predicted methyltransferase
MKEMRLIATSLLILSGTYAFAQANDVESKIQAAMAADIRTEAEMGRDRNRKAAETLAFFQLRDDMRVMELLPGGGWYTKILAPVLRDNGEFYVAIGINNVRENLQPETGFDHIEIIEIGVETERSGPFGTNNLPEFDFGVRELDLVVTFRNMHNFTPEGRMTINEAVFQSLASGGLYGVIDHSLRHMEPLTSENRRRSDAVDIILEVQAAGFELVDSSDLHYRPDDELRYEVGRRSVTGNTDRYTLLFKKP